jgi:hypothetical protein
VDTALEYWHFDGGWTELINSASAQSKLLVLPWFLCLLKHK